MAPKKVVSREEKKKPSTVGVPAKTFFGKRGSAAPASGEQAQSSTPTSTVAPRPKPMSVSEVATAIMTTPTSSDVELDLSLSQSSTQSFQETQQSGQQPAAVALPDVGAEQEVELPGNQETPVLKSLAPSIALRKRKVATESSSSSTTSEEGDHFSDMDWVPPEPERHQETLGQRQRKVPGSLTVMEGGDNDDDNDDAVIVEVEAEESSPAPPAPRDEARVARPASIFLKPQQTPPTTTPCTAADTQLQMTRPHPSSSSSGIGSVRSKKFVSAVWDFFTVSPHADNIAVCSICHTNVSRGKLGTHLGTGGQLTHLKKHHGLRWEQHQREMKGLGGKGQASQGTSGPPTVVGGEESEYEEVGASSDILLTQSTSVVPSTQSVDSSLSATSEWHKTRSEPPIQRAQSLPPPSLRKLPASVVAPEKRKKKQATIPAMFRQEGQYERNHPTALLYNGKLAKMLALDLLPFSFVEGVGFLEFVATICPKWRVPSRTYFARVAVPALHHRVLELISQRLKKSVVHTIHMTTDMWTSCSAIDFMCITAHWISLVGVKQKISSGLSSEESFQSVRQHATVAMFSMNKAHTAANILEEFKRKVEEWLQPLGQRIGFVATDNGSNIVKAMSDGGYFRVLCLAHCINLVVQDFLKKEKVVSDLLTTCRKICTHFSHSFKARKQLRIIQRSGRMPVRALIQEVQTRWNSTFYMLQRLSEQRRPLYEYMIQREGDATVRGMTMEAANWNLVKYLTQMLCPFEQLTREVSKEDSTMGQAIPMLHVLQEQLKKECAKFDVGGENENTEACELTGNLISRLASNTRLQNEIIRSKEYICATILDPRYKRVLSSFFPFRQDDVSKYKKWIVDRARDLEEESVDLRTPRRRSTVLPSTSREGRLVSEQPIKPSSTRTPETKETQGPAPTSTMPWFETLGLESVAEAKSKESWEVTAPMTIERMFNEYLDEKRIVYVDQNPLIYWYERMEQWPELSRLAINYLACPIASVSSERVFSAAGAVVTERRTSLSPQNVERLTMIKMNQHFIPPDFSVPEYEEEEEEEEDSSWSSLMLADKSLGTSTEFEDELCFPD